MKQSRTSKLIEKGLCNAPLFLKDSIQYETITGSVAYGVSSDNSDTDLYGFCIPPKDIVFPHLSGEIFGFGKQVQRFEQYQQHDIKTERINYDIVIYNIVKYFQLCMENNPNMIDSLFTPDRCVTFNTPIGKVIRENRQLFLHKGAWFKFKGYSYSQLHKLHTKVPEGKRKDTVEKYGYDVKFAYHVVRLLCEVEQILVEGTIDLERNREQLKSIRKGEWSLTEIENYFKVKELSLEQTYASSTLRHSPDEEAIKKLLLNCLEMYYGKI